MNAALLEQLLLEGESSRLDYKAAQYPIGRASDDTTHIDTKAELVKDVVAMANAWRNFAAYILIGVREVPGQRAHVVGIGDDHLDDANLQQLVNSKLNNAVQFSYSEVQHDGHSVGIIEIPLQERPVFLKVRFGPLAPEVVYIRRGTSTGTADPEEVFKMGATATASSGPRLTMELADLRGRQPLGCDVSLALAPLLALQKKDVPDLGDPQGMFSPLSLNRDYYRQINKYLFISSTCGHFGFLIHNASSAVAIDVRAELTIDHSPDLVVRDTFPTIPMRTRNFDWIGRRDVAPPPPVRHDVTARRRGELWTVHLSFGKVQPGATVWTRDELVIGTFRTLNVQCSGRLFGDNFDPIPVSFMIRSSPSTPRQIDRKDLYGWANPTERSSDAAG